MFYIKKYWYICLILLIFILVFFVLNINNTKEEIIEVEQPLENITQQAEKDIESTIKIDIKGAVNNPGVYELKKNSRVNDAIAISGGLKDNADTSTINLSKNLTDEMVIVIYTKEEIKEMLKGSTSIKYIEKECICPKLENDACIDNIIDNTKDDSSNDGKISLNKATIEQLMTLSGIGQIKAEAIISYREKNGGFKAIEELMEVDGIGESTYNKIKNQLTL